jgi:uncharacterized membrane protein YeaQ/YmgE (transglycosylase-associated protein family)
MEDPREEPWRGGEDHENDIAFRAPLEEDSRLSGSARKGAALSQNRSGEEHMGWIVTLVVGGIIGWLASLVMKTNKQMGVIANVIVGIVGSSIGFWLAGMMGLAAYGAIAQWAVAVAGAAVLIFILKALGIFK